MKAYRGPVTLFLIFKHVCIAAKCALVINVAKVLNDDLSVCRSVSALSALFCPFFHLFGSE